MYIKNGHHGPIKTTVLGMFSDFTSSLYRHGLNHIKKKRQFVITIFYSTQSSLVQGQLTEKWVASEFPKLRETIKMCNKNEHTGSFVDKTLSLIDFNDEDFWIDHDNLIKKQTETPKKTVVGTPQDKLKFVKETIPVHDDAEDKTQEFSKVNQKESEHGEIEKVKFAIHMIESNQIDRDKTIERILKHNEDIAAKMSEILKMKSDITEIKKTLSAIEKKVSDKCKFQEGKPSESEVQDLHDEIKEIRLQMAEDINFVDRTITTGVHDLKDAISKVQEMSNTVNNTSNTETNTVINKAGYQAIRDHDVRKDATKTKAATKDDKQRSENSHENMTDFDLWIIGTSITKDLRAKKMYRNKRVKITTLRDKTFHGAKEFIKTSKVKAKTVMVQVGSNDLDSETPDDVMEQLEEFVDLIKEKLPNAKLILCEVLPRYYRDRRQTTEYQEKRNLYNLLLNEYCSDLEIQCVKFNWFFHSDFYDGIHMNENGIRLYVRTLKEVVNPLLGMKSYEQSEGRGQGYVNFDESSGPQRSNRNSDFLDNNFSHRENRNRFNSGRHNYVSSEYNANGYNGMRRDNYSYNDQNERYADRDKFSEMLQCLMHQMYG